MIQLVYSLLTMWATGLIAKLVIGAGMTFLVAVAMDQSITAILDQASGYITGLPSVALQLMLLGGVGTMISIIGGAMITKALVNTAGRILGVKLNGGTGAA